jgi:hypothetical protein
MLLIDRWAVDGWTSLSSAMGRFIQFLQTGYLNHYVVMSCLGFIIMFSIFCQC